MKCFLFFVNRGALIQKYLNCLYHPLNTYLNSNSWPKKAKQYFILVDTALARLYCFLTDIFLNLGPDLFRYKLQKWSTTRFSSISGTRYIFERYLFSSCWSASQFFEFTRTVGVISLIFDSNYFSRQFSHTIQMGAMLNSRHFWAWAQLLCLE